MLILKTKAINKVIVSATAIVGLFLTSAKANVNATSQVMVHSGDTIRGISQKYHVSQYSLENVNHLITHGKLQPGEKLTLPNDTDNHRQSSQNNQNTQDLHSSIEKLSPKEQAAKNWISYHESRGKYHVKNGQYYGKFELDTKLLHGDYSKANQEQTADRYVHNRYGSWQNAKRFWQAHNWY